ncbi:MAG: methyltransferase domain-containing protein [Chloroflexi bacterium]|nr:methyltransferase domain-containing protein [Chloroflexota bacterium]MCC6895749.1 methyltransferase domain-containing protein [Anaerolineae bacterium]
MTKPDWWYDEFRHFAVDFDDPQQVAAYDARQGTKLAGERELVRRLGITAGQQVVEFGTGTGAFAQAAAEVGASVIAVDISPAMLAYAEKRAAEAGLSERTSFVREGFLSYKHNGAPADFIVTKYAFHHLPDFWKGIALNQFAAMLKPNGKFYLEDVVFSFSPDAVESSIEAWIDRVGSGQSFSRADFAGHVRDEYSTYGWILEGLIERAGFGVVERDYTAPTYANYLCMKKR